MVRFNRKSSQTAYNGRQSFLYIQSKATIRRFKSLKPTQNLAIFIFFICLCSSISVIIMTGNGHVEHLYSYYDNHKTFINNNNGNDPARQKAIENAKKETKHWVKVNQADEIELDSIISAYQETLQKLKKEEKAAKEKKKLEEEAANENSSYYLYYQDDYDIASTVIGLPSFASPTSSVNSNGAASAIDLMTYQRFVGSLRQTGYSGHLIIGIDSSNAIVSEEIMTYLQSKNVTVKQLLPVECTFEFAKKNQKCYHPYSHIKREWSNFPLARDWLASCDTCIGSVVIAPIKDTIFQRNPFGQGMPIVQRLHLYELHPLITAAETSAGVLLKACENTDLDKINKDMERLDYIPPDKRKLRILSAGIAVGTRDDIIDYLGAIHSVMREWMHRSQCHFEHSSSDDGMAIVNYLRLEQRLPHRTRIIPHRTGIVNNVGYEGRIAYEAHVYLWQFKGLTEEEAGKIPYEGGEEGNMGWIGSEYLLTDEEGNFIDVFFQKSAVIYEYNSFGPPFTTWFDKKLNLSTKTSSSSTINAVESSASIEVNQDGIDRVNSNSTNTTQPEDGKMKSSNNDENAEQDKIEGKNNDDDYYIKDEQGNKSSNTTATSALSTRKVKNTTEVIAEQQTAFNATKNKEDENLQPMYYKDHTSDDSNTTNATIIEEGMNASDEFLEKKIAQIVPVEETLEEDKKKEDSLRVDGQGDDKVQDIEGSVDAEKGNSRNKRRKDEQ